MKYWYPRIRPTISNAIGFMRLPLSGPLRATGRLCGPPSPVRCLIARPRADTRQRRGQIIDQSVERAGQRGGTRDDDVVTAALRRGRHNMGHRRAQSALGAVALNCIADPSARGVAHAHQLFLGVRLGHGCRLQHQAGRGPAPRCRPHAQKVASLLERGDAHRRCFRSDVNLRCRDMRLHAARRNWPACIEHSRNSDRRGRTSPTLDGEALAPLGAPAREHAPPGHGLHALPETMAPLAHDVARLIGPLHAPSPPPAWSLASAGAAAV